MTLKIVSIICFSLLLCSCQTLDHGNKFPLPEKPYTEKVEFQEVEGGYFISEEDGRKLANNIDELKAYVEKLEILVDHINNQ